MDIVRKSLLPMTPQPRRGYIFLVTIVAMVVLLILGAVSLTAAGNSMNHAAIKRTNAVALSLAEAGAHAGHAWVTAQRPSDLPKVGGEDVTYPAGNAWIQLPGGECKAVIKAVQSESRNGWGIDANYVILGVGRTADGKDTHNVLVQLEPRSFSLYGYFENKGASSNWWVSRISQFSGPFHSNGNMYDDPTRPQNVQIAWNNQVDPDTEFIFDGEVTSSTMGINWRNSKWQVKAPVTDADWRAIFTGGKNALKLGVSPVPFPDDAGPQQSNAWGGDPALDGVPNYPNPDVSKYPGNAGVYLADDRKSGIYIVPGRDPLNTSKTLAPSVTFSKGGESVQVIDIQHSVYNSTTKKWSEQTTRITADLVNNSTTVAKKTGTATEFTTVQELYRVPTGVIYSTGDIGGNTHRGTSADKIGGVSGLLVDNFVVGGKVVRANNWTVATDFAAGKNITITNNLAYETAPVAVEGENTAEHANRLLRGAALGLVAGEIKVPRGVQGDQNYDHTAFGVRGVNDIMINGSLMAIKGKVEVDYGDNLVRGDCTILGGTIVHTYANIGQFNTSSFTVEKGYLEKYLYDKRMADGPLTAFPQTNLYNVLSWQDLN